MWDDLTPFEREWKETCRRFAAEVIAPRCLDYDARNCHPQEVHDRAYERGLMNVGFPEALGGRGYGHRALVVGGEELAAACAPTAFTMGFNHGSLRPVLEAGTEVQKEAWVKGLLARRGYASLCFTEEGLSGSNLMEVAARAVRTDRGWTVTGTKCMTGNGCVSELFLVLADAVEGGRRRGLTLVMVPRGPGVTVGPNIEKVGFRCLTTPTIRFDDALVPAENVLGGVGEAEPILLRTLDFMRFGGASVILGLVVGALRDIFPWIEERKVYLGEPLIQKSHVQLELAEIYADLQVARMMLWRAADLLDRGRRCSAETAIAKLLSSRLAVRATNALCQMYGWRGVDRRFGIEKRVRDARVTTIYEGTSEIQLLSLFREMRRSMNGDRWL